MQGTLDQIGRTTTHAPDLGPVSLAIERFGDRATAYEQNGVDPTIEIEAVHRLNPLDLRAANGYAAARVSAIERGARDGRHRPHSN